MIDRSTKTFIAVFTLVAALILAVNHIIEEAPLADYGLAALLFLISLGFWAWIWVESQEEETETALAVSEDQSRLREWTIADDVDVPEAIITRPPDPKVVEPEPPVTEAEPESATEEITSIEESETLAVAAEVEEPTAPSNIADDLERIEGIGPKYKDVLIAEGIDTFDKLATLSLGEIEQAAKNQGMRRRASMKTWAEQAALAAKGDWNKLDALQEELFAGRRG